MVAGIVFQMASISVFAGFFVDFLRRASRLGERVLTGPLKILLITTTVSCVLIFIRSIYRTVELAQGWKGHSDISTYDYLLKLNRWVVGHDVLGSELPTDGFISNYWNTIRSIEWHRHTAIIYKK